MMRHLINRLAILIILVSVITSCEKDNLVPDASEVNQFIWDGLKTYYFWTDEVDNLANTKFQNKDSLNRFLNRYTDPEELFEDLLYKRGEVDKWSFIVDNSKEIDDWISGISESMGFDFKLLYISETSNDLIGYVRYVLKGSPAYKAGIKRGDFFLKVNNTQLTVSNYKSLLFSNLTYTLTMATVENNTIYLSDKTHTMTAVKIHENPIFLDTVYTINGSKVGYLVYNGFTAEDSDIKISYDLELNKVFGEFKSAGIQKLIIDLRYNGGGSIQTAGYLASMIYSTDASKIFCKRQYNSLVQSALTKEYGANWFNSYFTSKISQTTIASQATINCLGLSQLYVITSKETASASELLINGLKPYISVKMIGSYTTGKNVGSITLKDEDDKGNVNPNNTWAMQPIVLKVANSLNFHDYSSGLPPDISLVEDVKKLLPLGDQDETLLKATLNDLRGIKSAPVEPSVVFKPFASRKQLTRFGNEMYDNLKPF